MLLHSRGSVWGSGHKKLQQGENFSWHTIHIAGETQLRGHVRRRSCSSLRGDWRNPRGRKSSEESARWQQRWEQHPGGCRLRIPVPVSQAGPARALPRISRLLELKCPLLAPTAPSLRASRLRARHAFLMVAKIRNKAGFFPPFASPLCPDCPGGSRGWRRWSIPVVAAWPGLSFPVTQGCEEIVFASELMK